MFSALTTTMTLSPVSKSRGGGEGGGGAVRFSDAVVVCRVSPNDACATHLVRKA